MFQVSKQSSRPPSRTRSLLVTLLLLAPTVACTGTAPVDEGGTGGVTAGTGGSQATGGKSSATGGSGMGGASGGSSATGGSSSGGTGGGLATGGKGGAGGASTGTGGLSSSGGANPGTGGVKSKDHCISGFDPQPTDENMKDGPSEYYPPGKTDPAIVDLTVQPEVLAWMKANGWEGGHVEWHAIRTCKLGGGGASHVNICSNPKAPPIPTDQNCQTAGDGYQFLLFHRHMMEALRQLWPKHTEQFTGFPKFPTTAADVPAQWRAAWTPFASTGQAAGKLGDEIDKPENLAKFPDEGSLGFWLQCQVGQTLKMSNGQTLKSDGIHFDLHNHWVRSGNTDHGVGNTNVNIENYMFWKLHGWIDNVWEKYRTAKGLSRKDAKYIKDMQDSCHEMDIESALSVGKDPPMNTDPLPVESGFFHEKVRPILESATNKCSGCHDVGGPEAQMALGGHISSKDIVAGLVNMPTIGGGQYKRVVPGKPDESWLYLKITAMTGTCKANGNQCYPSVMPPSSDMKPTVTAADAAIIRQWITDGAAGPP